MLSWKTYNAVDKPTVIEKRSIVSFLHQHLENYGDDPRDILKAVDFAVKDISSFGGFILVAVEEEEILGIVVVNRTGMSGYIPENILVYIATHGAHRGKGVGKALMERTIQTASGDIALHVEENNPARHLYEKYGFTNPYLEMRYKR